MNISNRAKCSNRLHILCMIKQTKCNKSRVKRIQLQQYVQTMGYKIANHFFESLTNSYKKKN